MNAKLRAWCVDVGERVAASFGEAVVAAVTAGALAKGVNASTEHVLLVAGLTAAAATLKGILATVVKGTVSPASLAPAQQPGQVEQDAPPPAEGGLFLTAPDRVADLTTDPTKGLDYRLTDASTGNTISNVTLTAPAGWYTIQRNFEPARQGVHDRVKLVPPPAGRKGGALPSPRDDRDYQAKLPTTIPTSVDYGAGLAWSMLLNDRIGDCYPVALLHALQVLTGYAPVDADALAIYEQVTGYDPHRTDANGNNPTDQGTYGRQLFDWARSKGLIKSYAAVPATRTAVKAAIAAHKAVLCEWALPVGVETEGDVWTMPRTGRAAGSWGLHATVEVGYTTRRNRNVTWGEEGTVTPPFEDAYLQAAWVVEVAPGTDVAAIMAKVRAV